jgi:acetyl esterase
MAKRSGRPPIEALPLAEARAEYRLRADLLGLKPCEMAAIQQRSIAGEGGSIAVRLYVPRGSAERGPLLIFYHGGGWTIGDLDTHDRACRYLAAEAACRVASVDYRLAPEHPFPAAPQDALRGWQAISANAAAWGADADRLALGGDSAGANLAIGVALHAASAGGAQPRLQLLIYPATDLAVRHPSRDRFAEGYLLTEAMIVRFLDYYIPEEAKRRDPRASPLLAPDLRNLAPAHIQTAGFDPLQDEGAAFARALAAAGVTVEHKHYPGLVHGYMQLAGYSTAAKVALDDAAAALRAATAKR